MQIERPDWAEFSALSRELLVIYRPEFAHASTHALADTVMREWMSWRGLPDWRCVIAREHAGGPVVGFAVGHRGTPLNSWHNLTRIALLRSGIAPDTVAKYLGDYLILAELHVLSRVQGRGLGARLLKEFMRGWPRSVQLTVREIEGTEPSRAWRLYRSHGFIPIARQLVLAGSTQPFAVMRRPTACIDDSASERDRRDVLAGQRQLFDPVTLTSWNRRALTTHERSPS